MTVTLKGEYDLHIDIIGGGLAGCEAAWQLAKRGIKVRLYEMKPNKMSPAHHSKNLSELVCSNSLRASSIENAAGLLKEELKRLDSLLINVAIRQSVPAGGALAVDREEFSKEVTSIISNHENIKIFNEEVREINEDNYTIIATGPLTSDTLSDSIKKLVGSDYLYFYDAAAPIVTKDSIDFDKSYFKSRYDKGDGEYINCPMTKDQYDAFYNELINADVVELKHFEKEIVFEGCMPIETMAKRGYQTMLFGPLKPVGLEDPITGKIPYAVVQLRQDNKNATLYNIVGFQTHLKFNEQKRVFSLIPGLENAEFTRFGVMHRNTFINSPNNLDKTYRLIKNSKIAFAGQITGVEGYIESIASGFLAGISIFFSLIVKKTIDFTSKTCIGALSHYISDTSISQFQPMNINFGILDNLEQRVKSKKIKRQMIAERSLNIIDKITENMI